jgi:hypothetical protein
VDLADNGSATGFDVVEKVRHDKARVADRKGSLKIVVIVEVEEGDIVVPQQGKAQPLVVSGVLPLRGVVLPDAE